MSRALVGIMMITLAAGALGGCRRGAPTPRGSFRPFPPLGQRIMVLAPHPDDEVLGAAGLIDTARHAGADVRVIVATDGAAGSAKTVARADLARERESETRRAVAELGLPPESISFLRASDGRLGALWDRGWGRAGDREASSADAIVEALRAAFATTAPDTVVLPMPLDEHPDHRALHHFALLAMLAASPETHPPEVLGYLIHGSRRWATASFDPAATEPPAEGCAGALFPWTQLVLDPAGVVRKAALIEVYRTQVGRSRRLLRYARRAEPFARGEIIVGRRSMSHTRPGVSRTRDGIVIRLPRAGCGIDPLAGDRVRFRFSRAGVLEERLVHLRGATGETMAGRAGQPTQVATDVRVEVDERSVRLHLAADPFFTVPGIFVEVLPPDDARVGAAWAFLWSSHPAADPSGGPPR